MLLVLKQKLTKDTKNAAEKKTAIRLPAGTVTEAAMRIDVEGLSDCTRHFSTRRQSGIQRFVGLGTWSKVVPILCFPGIHAYHAARLNTMPAVAEIARSSVARHSK
jgi:hypothetical protein